MLIIVSVDENTLLKEYYKKAKPHLNEEEIGFIMEDNFSFDEDLDEERDVRKKKLAKKEEIAKAKNFLEETKKKILRRNQVETRRNSGPTKSYGLFQSL